MAQRCFNRYAAVNYFAQIEEKTVFRIYPLIIIALLFSLFSPQNIEAKPNHLFKIASLAPEGSVWVDSFKEFAAEVSEKTGGEVGFRIYPGGIMGDDRAMYRKMRAGQLQGGGFTMTGIADIVPDFRVLAIPFLFRSYDEMDYVSAALQPLFTKRFGEQGLQFVAMTEVGFVYTFSNQPRLSVKDLQQAKTWAPANDPLTATFLASLDISPIPLTIPDVLSSLQTGLVDTAFNSLYGSIVLQWFTKAPFVTDTPYGYAYGVFLLSRKVFDKLSEDQKQILNMAAKTHFTNLIKKTRQSNEESRKVLTEQGVTFVSAPDDVIATLEEHRDSTIKQLIGTAFSQEIYAALTQALTDYRLKNKNAAN